MENLTTQKRELPQLCINEETRYKMVIPVKVEQKIRLACAACPDHSVPGHAAQASPGTEWSGILFYTYKGSFEKDNLEIICQDILIKDVGNSTYTEWKMDPEVAGYMVDEDLFDVQLGAIHSHHGMNTFFSGTDTGTLREEGFDRNNFVSLIVNNEGKYSAAITRYNRVKGKAIEEVSYEFFGDGTRTFEQEYDIEDTYVEYFMLDIVRKVPKGIMDFMCKLNGLINRRKTTSYNYNYNSGWKAPAVPKVNEAPIQLTVKHDETKPTVAPATNTESKNPPAKQGQLFFDSTIHEEKTEQTLAVDPFIEDLCYQLIFGNIFIDSKTEDLLTYVQNDMYNDYKARFGTEVGTRSEFAGWVGNMLEYLIHDTYCVDLEEYNTVDRVEIVASMMHDFLAELPYQNVYLNKICEQLKDFFN